MRRSRIVFAALALGSSLLLISGAHAQISNQVTSCSDLNPERERIVGFSELPSAQLSIRNAYNYGPMTLIFNRGASVVQKRNGIINGPKLGRVINFLGGQGATDLEKIDDILARKSSIQAFDGPVGLLYLAWLTVGRDYLIDQSTGDFRPGLNLRVDPKARLVDFTLERNLSGIMQTILCLDVYQVAGQNLAGYFAINVRLGINPCGYRIYSKAKPGGPGWPDDVFEGSILGLSNNDVPRRFDYKLEAVAGRKGSNVEYDGTTKCDGDGPYISVLSIATSQCKYDNGSCDGSFVPIENSGDDAHYFDLQDDDCVDMMFESYPELVLPGNPLDLDEPLMYCLGRCTGTTMINTGL